MSSVTQKNPIRLFVCHTWQEDDDYHRIFEYLDLVPAISDAPGAIRVDRAPGPIGRIEFRDVVFRYPDAADEGRPTLQGISFVAEPGQHVAFVGPSGAGKTTILYLTPRLYEVSGGEVLFAGADVRSLTQESIIDHVGIVSQETYLFHATIRETKIHGDGLLTSPTFHTLLLYLLPIWTVE